MQYIHHQERMKQNIRFALNTLFIGVVKVGFKYYEDEEEE